MTTLSLILPEIGKPDKTQDPKINTAFTTIQTWANGNIGTGNLEAALFAGSWEAVTLGAKVEESALFQTVRCRKEGAGAIVRLRGAVKVKAGQTLVNGETALTLPVGLRPPGTVGIICYAVGTFVLLSITAAGVLSINSTMIATGEANLDGIAFNIT